MFLQKYLCALLLSLSFSSVAIAQSYPSRPITIVSPFPAGSTTDTVARILAEYIQKTLHQPVIVENRPGAGGTIGTTYVARAPADGYTLLMASQSHTANPSLYRNIPWDPVKSFAPVAMLGAIPNVIVVLASSPFKTLIDLIGQAKVEPGKLNYASGGTGTSMHLTAELLKNMAGIDLLHIPYKSNPEALNALLAGDVATVPLGMATAKPRIQSGELRALAVTTPKRSRELPNVLTVAECGFPKYDVRPWYAVLAPANTPDAIIKTLNAAVNESVNAPKVRERLSNLGLELDSGSPAKLAEFLREDTQRWFELIRQTGIRLQ